MDGIKNNPKPAQPVDGINRRSGPSPGVSGSPAASAPPAPPTERVTLTEGALALLGRSSLDPREPPVDSKRVAELRHAIERGSYEVDPARIADRLLRTEDDL